MDGRAAAAGCAAIFPSLLIVFRPTRGWRVVREARPRWFVSLAVQVLPFSLLALVAWPQASTVILALAAVLMMALGLFVLAPWSGVERSWDRSVAVAAYAATPVLATWILLAVPMFAMVPVAALIHGFALCYLGVQEVLGCRETEAALFVAFAGMFGVIASMLAGGLCSAAGWL